MNVAHGIQKAQHNEVGRRANGCQNTADGAGVSRHQHKTGCIFIFMQMNLPPIGRKHFFNGC